jgi:quinoprotein relay system zinc metallohydrolase 2
LHEVAAGVYAYHGPNAEANANNRGATSNVGVVIGDTGIAVIDTGGSLVFGLDLRSAIREISDKPITHVINTHVHPDHVFGNAAFLSDEPEFVGHDKLAAAMAARAEFYTNSLRRLVGPAFDGTEPVLPTLPVAYRLDIVLGNRILKLESYPTAHTDNDVTVLDVQTGTLFAGDLVFMERLPVVDGSAVGWLDVLSYLTLIDAERVVPGHGPVHAPWPDAAGPVIRYLDTLVGETREIVKRGGSIDDAIESVGASERGRWVLFEVDHPRNVTATFVELEWE